jgi:hypothetical protein
MWRPPEYENPRSSSRFFGFSLEHPTAFAPFLRAPRSHSSRRPTLTIDIEEGEEVDENEEKEEYEDESEEEEEEEEDAQPRSMRTTP